MYSNAYPSRSSDYRDSDVNELNFDEDSSSERHQPSDLVRKAGLTEAAVPGQGPTADDLTPETLFEEDGANFPNEPGDGLPNDQRLTIVDEDEIGGGRGLDEAEWAHIDPLDGEPWDADRP